MFETIMNLANISIWYFIVTGIIISAIVKGIVDIMTELFNMIIVLVRGHQEIINHNYIIDKEYGKNGDKDGKKEGRE